MATKKVTKIGYGKKVSSSFGGIIGGFIAIAVGIGLLWWNEGNSVKDIKKIKEGRAAVTEVENKRIDTEHDKSLVHVSGLVTTADTLRDEAFNIAENALVLIKDVEMYQYQENVKREEKENLGGSTTVTETFSYENVWSSSLISSDQFEESWRKNPKSFNNKARIDYAKRAALGAFELDERVIEQLSGATDLNIRLDSSAKLKSYNAYVYQSADPKNPEIGDERIKFSVVLPQNFSIIAQQRGNSFGPFKTKVGKQIFMVQRGLLTADEMFDRAQSASKFLRWALRIGGFFLLFIGFSGILKPLTTLLSVVPFLSKLLGYATGLVAFVLAAAISFVVIAIAWFFYRPLLAIGLLAAAVGLIYYLRMRAKNIPKQEIISEVGA